MASTIHVTGGKILKGEVKLSGAKNSGFKLMVASLLSEEPSLISNLPEIIDLLSTGEIIRELGGRVDFKNQNVAEMNGRNLHSPSIPIKFSNTSRANIYFVAPLIYRFGKAFIPLLGGCDIGKRPLNRHFEGLRALGAKIRTEKSGWLIRGPLKGGYYRFPKNSHGGTDILIMTSVLAPGETIIDNAALEPEVDDLINFLNSMGAKIARKKRRRIYIKGVRELHGTTYSCMPDRNEAVTFGIAALTTRGNVFIKDAKAIDLEFFLKKVSEVGGNFRKYSNGIRFFYKKPLKATNITTKPHPRFMTDWQSMWAVLMTQANGESIIRETVFENRFQYTPYLTAMGAKISLFNPPIKNKEKYYNFNLSSDSPRYFHAIRISGPTPLKPVQAKALDLRSGATLLLASLVASGRSRIKNAKIIDRGYDDFVGKLKSLGAVIQAL